MQSTPSSQAHAAVAGSDHRTFLMTYGVLIVLILGLALRFQLGSELGFVPEQEYQSALLTRALFTMAADNVPEWEEDIAHFVLQQENFSEPPVLEAITAVMFVAADNESILLARGLSSVFWIVGGFFLFLIIHRLSSAQTALALTAYFTFLPTGILLGRSFQPDSLVILFVLAGLYVLIRREESQSRRDLIVASFLLGIAVLIRPLTAFAFLSLEIVLWIRRIGAWRTISSLSFWLSLLLIIAPVGIYATVCVIWIEPDLFQQLGRSLNPYRLITFKFWTDWIQAAASFVGVGALLFSLIGFNLVKNRLARSLVLGLGLGYAASNLLFGDHVNIVGGNHLLLFIIVSLSATELVEMIAIALRARSTKLTYRMISVAALSVFAVLGSVQAKESIRGMMVESANTARIIGEKVEHSTRVTYIAKNGATPLMYKSRTAGIPWPERELSNKAAGSGSNVVKSFVDMDFHPEYLVVTDFDTYRQKHADLRSYVEMFGQPISETTDYLIYRIPGLNLSSSESIVGK